MNDDAYTGMKLVDLIRTMYEVGRELEEAEAARKEIAARYDHLRLSVVPQRCEEEGIESMRVEGVGTLYLTSDMQVSIQGDARDAAYKWLEENGLDGLIKPTVNSSSLKAALKLELKEGRDVPEDLFRIHAFTRAAINKS
jgi:hypothetical protein